MKLNLFASIRSGRIVLNLMAAILSLVLMGILDKPTCYAQLPVDLPWAGSRVNGRLVIVQAGIAGASCGTTTNVPSTEQFSFGMFNIDGVVPITGHTDESANSQVYHHPSWSVSYTHLTLPTKRRV